MEMERRAFLGGLLALVAAPAIVRVQSIMPVSVIRPDTLFSVAVSKRGSYRWIAMPGTELKSPEGLIWDIMGSPSWTPDCPEVVTMEVMQDPVSGMLFMDTNGPMDISLMTQERHGKILTPRVHQFTLDGRREIEMGAGRTLNSYASHALKPEGVALAYLDDEGERIPFT